MRTGWSETKTSTLRESVGNCTKTRVKKQNTVEEFPVQRQRKNKKCSMGERKGDARERQEGTKNSGRSSGRRGGSANQPDGGKGTGGTRERKNVRDRTTIMLRSSKGKMKRKTQR